MRILSEGHASTQKEIVDALRSVGHDVTQATVSRYLREIGASKLTVGGEALYRLPDQMPRVGGDLMARNLMRTLEEFAIDIRPAGSLIVLLTAPGHAAAVARAVDMAGLESVVGTVAGDDTIFVATPSTDDAHELAEEWKADTEPAAWPKTTEGTT